MQRLEIFTAEQKQLIQDQKEVEFREREKKGRLPEHVLLCIYTYMTVEELIEKISKLSNFDRQTLLMKKFQDEDLVQNRKMIVRIPDSLHANANFEYTIRLASQITFEIVGFDNKLSKQLEIADKVLFEKNMAVSEIILRLTKDSVFTFQPVKDSFVTKCSKITIFEETDIEHIISHDSEFAMKMISCFQGGHHIKEINFFSLNRLTSQKKEIIFDFIKNLIKLEKIYLEFNGQEMDLLTFDLQALKSLNFVHIKDNSAERRYSYPLIKLLNGNNCKFVYDALNQSHSFSDLLSSIKYIYNNGFVQQQQTIGTMKLSLWALDQEEFKIWLQANTPDAIQLTYIDPYTDQQLTIKKWKGNEFKIDFNKDHKAMTFYCRQIKVEEYFEY